MDQFAGIPELWILRHGETEWNTEGRLQGLLDSALTELGHAQAIAQNAILRAEIPGDVTVYSSPSPRAAITAEIAIEGLGLELKFDKRLTEIDLGDWSGLKLTDIQESHPDLPFGQDPHFWKFMAPGGESLEMMTERVASFLSELSGPSVIVTHGVTSRLIRALILGGEIAQLSSLPGGQGVVHHIKDRQAKLLSP